MKNYNERFDYNVSTWVSLDLKNKLYEIAEQENTSISNIVRLLLEKCVNEYMGVNVNGNYKE